MAEKFRSIVIAISGKIGSGKDTLADILEEEIGNFERNDPRWAGLLLEKPTKRDGFAYPLKEMVYCLTGCKAFTQEEKLVFLPQFQCTVGVLLQKIGEGLRNTVGEDIWVNSFKSRMEGRSKNTTTIITDLRYRSELKGLKEIEETSNVITVRLEGDPGKVRENSDRDLNHKSETDLDLYGGWMFKYNNIQGIENLTAFAKTIIVYLQQKQLIN